MELHQPLDELQKNLNEIKKQHRLKRLRRLLKFLLIGFLIGRDSEKRISELTTKNRLIIESLLRRFENLEHVEQRIKEFADEYSRLIQIEEKMRTFDEELLDTQTLVLNVEEGIRKYHEMIVTYAKMAVEKKGIYHR